MEDIPSVNSDTESKVPGPNISESKDPVAALESQTRSTSVEKVITCWFYTNYGRCKFGSNCRYRHVKPRKKGQNRESKKTFDRRDRNLESKAGYSSERTSVFQSSTKPSVCRFYKASDCRAADHCGLGELPCSDTVSRTIIYHYRGDDDEESVEDEAEPDACMSFNDSQRCEFESSSYCNGVLSSKSLPYKPNDNLKGKR